MTTNGTQGRCTVPVHKDQSPLPAGTRRPRETAAEKAARLLAEGHVRVTEAGPGIVTATVRGTTAMYVVTYRRGGWRCPCAHRGRCSHLAAMMAVTHPVVTHPATDRRLSGVTS